MVLLVFRETTVAKGQSTPPQISAQPVSQSVASGATVTLSVTATGTLPLSYHWQFNGTNLPSAASRTHFLLNVSLLSGGDYTVVITNAFGAITSDVARVTIVADLVFRMVGLRTHGFVALDSYQGVGDERGGVGGSSNSRFLIRD